MPTEEASRLGERRRSDAFTLLGCRTSLNYSLGDGRSGCGGAGACRCAIVDDSSPGFIRRHVSVGRFSGWLLELSYFDRLDHGRAWRDQPEHLLALERVHQAARNFVSSLRCRPELHRVANNEFDPRLTKPQPALWARR